MTTAAPAPTDLKSALEEIRASVVAEAARKGLKGTIQEAVLRLFSVLLAMLEDFAAGRLARIAPVAEPAGDGAVAERCPGSQRGFGVENGEARAASWRADFGGVHEATTTTPRLERERCMRFCGRGRGPRRVPLFAGKNGARRGRVRGKGSGIAVMFSLLDLSLRPPRFGMIPRLRRRSGWRNARGIRRAFPPYGEMADADEGLFSKMQLRANGSARACRSNVKTTPQRPEAKVYFPNT